MDSECDSADGGLRNGDWGCESGEDGEVRTDEKKSPSVTLFLPSSSWSVSGGVREYPGSLPNPAPKPDPEPEPEPGTRSGIDRGETHASSGICLG